MKLEFAEYRNMPGWYFAQAESDQRIAQVWRTDMGWTFQHIYNSHDLDKSIGVYFDSREKAEELCTHQVARFQKRLSV